MSSSRLVFDESERVASWVAPRAGHFGSWGDYYAMGAEVDGELVCGIVFNGFTDTNMFLHFAMSRPTKLLIELMDHAYVYAFGQLEKKRVTGFVEVSKTKIHAIARRLGFVEEGMMERAGVNGDDIKILVLWPHNFRKGTR